VVGVLVEVLPQPLAARASTKLTQSAPTLNALVTLCLPSVAIVSAIRNSCVDELTVSISDSEVARFLPARAMLGTVRYRADRGSGKAFSFVTTRRKKTGSVES
jgi:Mg2+/Co2+ transporter CorB